MNEWKLKGIVFGERNLSVTAYLKGLGVLRMVSQKDPQARSYWDSQGDYHLRTVLSKEELIDFFLNESVFSPVASPWSASNSSQSGYANRLASLREEARYLGQEHRFQRMDHPLYAEVDRTELLRANGTDAKKRAKKPIVMSLRGEVPDDYVDWLDTVAPDGDTDMLPLTGYGGDFSASSMMYSNYASALEQVYGLEEAAKKEGRGAEKSKKVAKSRRLLENSLFGTFLGEKERVPGVGIGTFDPSLAAWKKVAALANPWDTILALDGTFLFLSSLVRRSGSQGARGGYLGVPWTIKGQVWLPIWTDPAKLNVLQHLFTEGRLQITQSTGSYGVHTALDFFLALRTGVDKGISSFVQFARESGNGKNSFLVPQGVHSTKGDPRKDGTRLLTDIKSWYLPSPESSKEYPSAVTPFQQALKRYYKEESRDVSDIFVAFGDLVYALSSSSNRKVVRPVWLYQNWVGHIMRNQGRVRDCAELRLAEALASTSTTGPGGIRFFREYMFSIGQEKKKLVWTARQPQVVWQPDTLASLHKLRDRWSIELSSGRNMQAQTHANLEDIETFIQGDFDDQLFGSLLKACAMLRRQRKVTAEYFPTRELPILYALLKLGYTQYPVQEVQIRHAAPVFRKAGLGDGYGASQGMLRRLRGSGLDARMEPLPFQGDSVKRAAAALVFPVGKTDIQYLYRRVS